MAHFFFPPPPPFVGGRQPYADRRTLPPSVAAVPVNDPPFSNPGKSEITRVIIALWQPNPWTYNFTGNNQPFQAAMLPPERAEFPPSLVRFRSEMDRVILSWQPPPPHPFMGGRQALDPSKLPPSFMAVRVDNPPIRQAGRTDWQIFMSYAPMAPLPTYPVHRVLVQSQRAYIIVFT